MPKNGELARSPKTPFSVIPADAGIQEYQEVLDPGFRRGDGLENSCEAIRNRVNETMNGKGGKRWVESTECIAYWRSWWCVAGGSSPPMRNIICGGTQSLTGLLLRIQRHAGCLRDYVKYVNTTKKLAHGERKSSRGYHPGNVVRDDELKPAKALPIYEDFKGKDAGRRISGLL